MAQVAVGGCGVTSSSEDLIPVNQRTRQRHNSSESFESECDTPDPDLDPDEYLFVETSHPLQVLSGLNDLRESSSFCDITICVGDDEYTCHKIVLASFSQYFKAMFSGQLAESRQDKVSINGVEGPMIKALIDYAYTSEVLITKTNVQSLLSVANLLEVLPVRDACCQFMEKNMDETNCLGIHCFAEAHACSELQEKAKIFTLRYFPEVAQQEEFLNLSQAKLIELVSDDSLCVDSEEAVYNAVTRWLCMDKSHSTDYHKVLEHVRLPLLSPYFLHDYVEKQEIIMHSAKCKALLEEAKTYHLLQDRRAELRSPRTRQRKSAGMLSLIATVS